MSSPTADRGRSKDVANRWTKGIDAGAPTYTADVRPQRADVLDLLSGRLRPPRPPGRRRPIEPRRALQMIDTLEQALADGEPYPETSGSLLDQIVSPRLTPKVDPADAMVPRHGDE